MIPPSLTRFDATFYKNKDASSPPPQIPLAGAVVEFFLPGATVAAFTVAGGVGAVTAHDIGAIGIGSILSAGPSNGPLLRVVSIDPEAPFNRFSVVRDDGEALATIPIGSRLYLMSNRPLLYADAAGSVPIGSTLTADDTGRVTGYVAAPRFDYVVLDAAGPTFVNSSSESISNHGVLSWDHDTGAAGRSVFVGLSWFRSGTPQPEPPTVAYEKEGEPPRSFNLLIDAAGCALYVLHNAPTGPWMIRATFTIAVGATGGAVTVEGLQLEVAPSILISAGTGTSAVNPSPAYAQGLRSSGLVLDTLAILDVPLTSATIPAAGAGQSVLWVNPGASTSAKVIGAGSSRTPEAGASDQDFATSWSWPAGPSAAWSLITVGLGRKVLITYVNAVGGTAPSPSWIDVLDVPRVASTNYPSIQNAIAALPPSGGEVFLSGATLLQTTEIVVNKDGVTLRGVGPDATIIKAASPNPNFDVLRVERGRCVVRDLQIDGNATVATPGKSCLVLAGPGVTDCRLENLILRGASRNGLHAQGIVSLLAMNVLAQFNKGAGVLVDRSMATPWNLCFIGCASRENSGRGMTIQPGAGTSLGGDNVVLLGCAFEKNLEATQGNALAIVGAAGVQVTGCYFEWAGPPSPPEFIYCAQSESVAIEACTFLGRSSSGGKVKRGVTFVNSSGAALLNNLASDLSDYLAYFDALTKSAVEYGNHESDQAPAGRPRLGGSLLGLFSLSGGSVKVYHQEALPTAGDYEPGALVWVGPSSGSTGDLYVHDGVWRKVESA